MRGTRAGGARLRARERRRDVGGRRRLRRSVATHGAGAPRPRCRGAPHGTDRTRRSSGPVRHAGGLRPFARRAARRLVRRVADGAGARRSTLPDDAPAVCARWRRLAAGTGRRRAAEAAADAGTHPGTSYLAGRARAHARAQSAPELEPLREALAPIVAAERIARHDRGPLLLTAYHLIPRGAAPAYRRLLRRHAALLRTRAAVSGPWPPYAFVPELRR